MFWMSYHDEAERAQALVSLARGCQEREARLAFLSSPAACEEAHRAVGQIDTASLPLLSFRPVELPVAERNSDQVWASTIEVIRAALLEFSALGRPVVAWIESPLPLKSIAKANVLQAYDEMLTALARAGAVASVIGAFRITDASARAVLSILDSSSALISAKMTVPCCPPWLITQAEHPFVTDIEPSHHTDPIFTAMFQAERLVALGQIGAGFAHELGNPLSIISSSLQYLHQRLAATNDPASDFTMTALHNVERMRELLGSMLNFAGVKKPRYELVDLKEAISEVLRFTSPECAQRGISVEVPFDPFLPRAWVDPGGVKQIVLNLVKNALDAISQSGEQAGGKTLRLRTRMGSQETAVIEVENSGAAIPADILPHLYRPFFTTKDGGTGLGLYLSRQIAEDHGGRLDVENLPDGVRFTLSLPFEQRED